MTIPTKQEIYGLLGVFEVACTHGDMAAQFKTKGELLDALAPVFAELERAEARAVKARELLARAKPLIPNRVFGDNFQVRAGIDAFLRSEP